MIRMLPILTFLFSVAAADKAAVAMPAAPLSFDAAPVMQVQYVDDWRYRDRRRPRITVYPDGYFDDYSYRYPARRGFEDRNPVPRGNMRGCTVDLGYGRYESCDK